jgi:hypothetical protein
MRFLFKTDYNDDIRLVPHSGYLWSYGALLILLVIAPFTLSSYLMSQLVFVCIYATVGVGLMILTGFTGQASLGHAAFLAIGAYTTGYLHQLGVPFPVYFLASGILTGIIGAMVGFRRCGCRASISLSLRSPSRSLSKKSLHAGKASPMAMMACGSKPSSCSAAPCRVTVRHSITCVLAF